ncbi:MlaD family protein [Rhodococcus gannanensis]|uniref:MlaD family protein n=1 Tax=Rhodococcus gannanensis TaxID=1960308 RepID=A0ABW4PAN4_9NOCA
MTTRRGILSIVATVVVFVAALAYVATGVLGTSPTARTTTMSISAPTSNGLHTGSAVLYRGVPIGNVTSVADSGTAIEITAEFDAAYQIPIGSSFVIENQSMIGESGLFVYPDESDDGPVVADGQQLTATAAATPASVPELLGSTQRLLDQVDPALVNELVDTISTALAGTDEAIDRLTPAAEVLAATMIHSQPALVNIISDSSSLIQRGEWVGPSTRPMRPELEMTGDELRKVIVKVRRFADYTNGGQIIRERWRPVLDRGAALATEYSPQAGDFAETLLPSMRSYGSLLSTVDIASLVEQAMGAAPDGSLHLNVTVPN